MSQLGRWPPSKRLLVAGVLIFVGVEPMDIIHDTLGNIPALIVETKQDICDKMTK